MRYLIHYRLDDVRKTPGKCRTDHRIEPGEVFYTADGRAIGRSCIADVAVDNTYRRNARVLASLQHRKEPATMTHQNPPATHSDAFGA